MTGHIYESMFPTPFIPQVGLFDFIFPSAPGVSTSKEFPETHPAFIDGVTGEVLFRGELHDRALRLKTGYKELLHLKRGDTVCVWGSNSIEWIFAVYGAMAAGLVASLANAAYAPHELAHQYNNSGSSAMFVALENLAGFEQARAELERPLEDNRVILLCKPEHKPKGTKYHCIFEILSERAEEAEHFDGTECYETQFLCYSSGTTGLPKGVMTTHNNMVSQMCTSHICLDPMSSETDALLGFLPMSHAFGLMAILLQPLTQGVPAVILPRFDELKALAAIEKYKVTRALFVPPVVLLFIHSQNTPKFNITSLKSVFSGAAPLSPELMAAFHKRYPHATVTQGYGMTETSPGALQARSEDSRAGHSGVGVLLPGYQARLVMEDGRDAHPGERGELWLRSSSIMKGYHANPEATAKTMAPGGWLKTGDVAVVDENNRFAIVDRVKELIKYKGFQVAPAELEALLLQQPKVIDAGVVGVYDESQATELPRGYIVANPSLGIKTDADKAKLSKEVAAWVAGRVAPHKRLVGGVIIIDAVPKSPSGKILRNILRKQAQQEFESSAKAKL